MNSRNKILICFSAECYKKFCKQQEKFSGKEKKSMTNFLSQANCFKIDSYSGDVLIVFENYMPTRNNFALNFLFDFLEDASENSYHAIIVGPFLNEISIEGTYNSPSFNISVETKFNYSEVNPTPAMVL